MKIKCTFKDPDTMPDAVHDAVKKDVTASIKGMEQPWSAQAVEAEEDARKEKALKSIREWMEFDEYITVEFDTVAGTATVVRR